MSAMDTESVSENGHAKPVMKSQDSDSVGSSNGTGKVVLSLVLIALVVGAYFMYRYNTVRESTDDAQIQGHIVPISARVGGTVVKVNVDDNQYVEAGFTLVELDPKDYQVALQKAEADLADAEAQSRAAHVNVPMTTTTSTNQLSTAQSGVAAAQNDVVYSRARKDEAEANLARANADLKRMEQLVAKDEVSHQQFDDAVAAQKAASAMLDAMKASINMAENRLAQARAQERGMNTVPDQLANMRAHADAADAAVARARANVERAKLDLAYTVVRAPAAGVVSKKAIEPGQTISAGQSVIALVPTEDIWVVANFKENQLKEMRPGQPVIIHVDAYGKDYDGKVDSIGGATAALFSVLPPENSTGNYVKVVQRIPVKLTFNKGQDKDHLLRPGMSVVPTVRTK
jgi:membrane fusion protein (multidrug efflux system)